MAKRQIINREISWLAFNERVLDEAADQTVPLFERIKFLGIFSNNRDEFFRVRVASVRRLAMLNDKIELGHEDPKKIFAQIQKITLGQQKRYEEIYQNVLRDLRKENVFIVNETELTYSQKNYIIEYFEKKVEPVLSPIMLDQVKKFPELKDKAIYLAAYIHSGGDKKRKEHHQYSLIEIPSSLPRFVSMPDENGKKYIIFMDDIIRFNLSSIFYFFKPNSAEAYTFKITRDAELDLDNDISKSFLEKMKKSLKARKRGAPVRFVFDSNMPSEMHRYLTKKMGITSDEDAFIPGGRYHNLKDLMSFPKIGLKNGYYEPLPAIRNTTFDDFDSYFDAIKKKDIMVHYPYQTFNHLIDFLKEAALDPNVKTIRICLYRVAKQSKIVNALINAARNGKKVIVVFELQARFDEENNIHWSNILEDEGVKVFFGFPGLKVHGKICLVSRKESGQTQYYSYLSTGNFHESTAGLYTDLGLFTAHNEITREVHKVFELFENAIWPNYRFKHLVLSPFYLRNRLVRLINKEINNAKAGKKAFIKLKINSLVDEALIQKLYQASQAGVNVKLIIRGVCALVPGVKGLSDNIEVISIIDRFLEHSRVYVFCNDENPLYFISSADWMVRNIDRRIEVTCPIYNSEIKQEIDEILDIQLSDNVKARKLFPNGNYIVDREKDIPDIRSQYAQYEYYKKKYKE